ncbi:LpqB family beta-propeller domain-containing protein [Allosalinactinospora lopnorensis]|uniref:LpqB family beta-propeller domain-containing protein n=1 Tax=Allosalinactinospora lopnorensis TaxID=1352348 RepID=UPI000696E9AB|nr:LpqB family beta-propeller domain-containing protein [Allosalinactinospora lopnorensis]
MTGCASVPTGGPVVRGSGGEDTGEGNGGYVRMLPAGPQPGVGENGLIKGFLRDMGSFEENHHAARMYLMPGPRETWAPGGDVLVYESMDSISFDTDVSSDGTAATIRMRGPQIARITGNGQYIPEETGEVIDVTFELARDDGGEWRINDLPDSLILGSRDVDRAYRPLNLYYFNRDKSTLVPDPVFLPVSSDNLATRLVQKLVSGPTEWLEPAVGSAFPEGATVDVAFDSGSVTVELRGGPTAVRDRYGMGAQLAWTLKQLPEVQDFALRIDGDNVDLPGGEEENLQATDDQWDSVNPSGVSGDPSAYFIRDGQLWSLSGEGQDDDQNEARVQGAPGVGDTPLQKHAVSLDEDRVAGIEAGLESVVLAEAAEGSEYDSVLSGGDYAALSWDGYGDLWVVEEEGGDRDDEERSDPGSKLWLLRDGSEPFEVTAPELDDIAVSEFRISRDGTRAALIAEHEDGPRLYAGRVISDGDDVSVGRLIPLARDLGEVADVAWRSGDQLAVLGQKERGAAQAFLVSLDGSTETTSAGAPTGADMGALTAAPGRPLLSSADDDQVWLTNDRLMWRYVTEGSNPVYPG